MFFPIGFLPILELSLPVTWGRFPGAGGNVLHAERVLLPTGLEGTDLRFWGGGVCAKRQSRAHGL